MKKFTKTLSIVLLVAMCVSMFTISSFADHNCADHAAKAVPHATVPATCTTDGTVQYWACGVDGCPHCYSDPDLTQKILNASDLVIPAAHNKQLIAGTAASCTATGMEDGYWCDGCGKWWDVDGNEITDRTIAALGHDYGEWSVKTAAGMGTEGKEVRKCGRCGVEDERTIPALSAQPFEVYGEATQEFSNTGVYTYEVNMPDVYEVTAVTAGGYNLYEGKGFYYTSDGKITVQGSAVASLISGESSIELEFTALNKYDLSTATCGGFYLNNETTVNTLTVDGFEQKGFIKGSTEAVAFQTNDSNPNNVRLYSFTSKGFVDITDFDMEKVGGMYTYTFSKAFLDTLDYGTYYVRCYYGADKYVSAGTIIISKSEVTANSTVLKFSNSTVSDSEYKYISGGTRPELYCQMFRDSAAKLQVSNDGYSWKDVSVYDYYIEQSGGKDTSYAWIKTGLLDNMKASSNVYFRVIIPAADLGTTTDAVSNWVKVTTGHNLRAVDTDKHVINSSKSLKFVASTAVDVVKVGSIVLDEGEEYAISKDGKTITLLADFLNARTAGSTYTLTAITVEGDEELKTTFKILTTAQASASPRTGDDSNIALWSALVLMSGAAMVAVLPRLKKEQ